MSGIARPVVGGPGPLRDLKDFLYELYVRAGTPTLDEMTSEKRKAAAGGALPSRATVQRIIGSEDLPPDVRDVESVTRMLAEFISGAVPRTEALRARYLWVAAYNALAPLSSGARERYFEALIRQHRVLELAALTPEAFDQHVPVALRQVFVPQLTRPDPPPAVLPPELWRRLVESGHLDEDDLPRDGQLDVREWLERARQVREQHLARPPVPALALLTDPRERTTVLLGDPGSGKSSLLRFVAVNLASRVDELSEGLTQWAGWLPVLIDLRGYGSRDWRTGPRASGTVLDFLDYLASHGRAGLPRDVMDSLLRQGANVVVMFDGLDELFDPAERDEAARTIAGFAGAYPRVRVVVTSRPVGYRRHVLDGAGFAVHTLQDLDRDRIASFVRAWYGLTSHGKPDELSQRVDRLLQAVDRSRPVRELAGNPLLLTVLAIIGQRRPLPKYRHEVLAYAVNVLVQHWDVERVLVNSQLDPGLIDENAKRDMLRRIAWRMQESPAGACWELSA